MAVANDRGRNVTILHNNSQAFARTNGRRGLLIALSGMAGTVVYT